VSNFKILDALEVFDGVEFIFTIKNMIQTLHLFEFSFGQSLLTIHTITH